jgi:formate dehydrogenase major subunit
LKTRITERVAPGVVYTTFHHPETMANVVTTDYSDWATDCPEYKVTAVQISPAGNSAGTLNAGRMLEKHLRSEQP